MKKKIKGALLFCAALLCLLPAVVQAKETDYPYLLAVNLTENIVTVYERDADGAYTVPTRAFVCSVGAATPEGTFRTTDRYTWRPLFGDVWGQYATRITGHILFHSVPYTEQDKSTLEYDEYNRLGEEVSAGCVRLTVEDAKWIYDNCPAGTTVRMYRGEVEEPLTPEEPAKIDSSDLLRRGWDPTDPDPANPWRQGVLRQMTMRTGNALRLITAYEAEGAYYLTAQDAKRVFAHLGLTIFLPESGAGTDSAAVWYRGAQDTVSCHTENGKRYYKLRDLSEVTGVSLLWDGEKDSVSLTYKANTVQLSAAAAETQKAA